MLLYYINEVRKNYYRLLRGKKESLVCMFFLVLPNEELSCRKQLTKGHNSKPEAEQGIEPASPRSRLVS